MFIFGNGLEYVKDFQKDDVCLSYFKHLRFIFVSLKKKSSFIFVSFRPQAGRETSIFAQPWLGLEEAQGQGVFGHKASLEATFYYI